MCHDWLQSLRLGFEGADAIFPVAQGRVVEVPPITLGCNLRSSGGGYTPFDILDT